MINQLKKLSPFIFLAILLVSCIKEDEPTRDEPEIETTTPPPTATIAYIYNNDVFTINSKGLYKKQLTFNQNAKENISLSYDLSKIAYLSTNKVPVIIDINGNLIDSLVDYPYSKELHWAPNNETLLFNCNDKLNFWGTDLNLKENIFPAQLYRRGFALSKNMDYAYSYRGSIYYQKANSTEYEVIYESFDGIENTHLKFSNDENRLYFSNDYKKPGISYVSLNKPIYRGDNLTDSDFERYRNERYYGFNRNDTEIFVEVWDEEMGYNIYVLNGEWRKYNNSRHLLDSTTPYHTKIPFDVK